MKGEPMEDAILPYGEHAFSRYSNMTEDVIHELQLTYLAGFDLGVIFPHIGRDDATIIVAESLEADRVANLEPEQLFDAEHIKPDRTSDFKWAALAEMLFELSDFAQEMENEETARDMWALAMAQLEGIARSPVASPLLWYEGIFVDLAGASMGEHEAIYWAKRALAHHLRYSGGDEALDYLRDLVDAYLAVDELDTGLAILAGMLRYDPGYIWTYNLMAISFDRHGLVDLGTLASQRALALIDARGDEENLRDQLTRCLASTEEAERRGREIEVDPDVLDDLRHALTLDFDAGEHQDIKAWLLELVPDLDEVEVKRPMRPADFPPPSRSALMRRGEEAPETPGRNDPCWCGSGKKYKRCHWQEDQRKRTETQESSS
ncbi:MAG: SEC-C metal-binding domain-containing protein [Anaerolineae bacterium]